MVNLLESIYFATALMVVAAAVRGAMALNATGPRRAELLEKARRYLVAGGLMGFVSIAGYFMLSRT